MLVAVLVAVSSVLLGAGLSFVPTTSRAMLGYMRTFATLAAVGVVVTHLLPEALVQLGPLSLLLFLAGWLAPALAHFIGQRSTSGRAQHAVLEAGYWGLVVHHVADGVGLGAYTRLPAERGSHIDVVVALAAHTVPLIAVVSLAYRSSFGTRAALLRSLGLALASVLGIALSGLVAAGTIEHFAPVIAAVAAGLLLPVVTHDLTEDPARGVGARSLDLLVAALGVAVSLLGVWRSPEPATRAFLDALADLSQQSALLLLVALAAAAFWLRTPEPRSRWSRAMLPAAVLGPESVLLSIALLGFAAAALRLLLSAATVATLWPSQLPGSSTEHDPPDQARHFRARAMEVIESSGPWLVLGLLLGALLMTMPVSAFVRGLSGSLFELALVASVSILTPVAAPAALLGALGLSALGASTGALLLFATLGPLVKMLGSGLRASALVTVVSVASAALCNALHFSAAPLEGALSRGEFGQRAAILLTVLLLFGIWQRGARIWLATIVRPTPHEHEHAHDVHGPHPPHG